MFDVRKNAVTLGLTLALATVVLTAAARAEDKRIAVVNVSDVFGRYDKVKSVQDTLEKEYAPTQKALQATESKLKAWKETIDIEIQQSGGATKNKKLFDEKQKFENAMFDFQAEYEGLLQKVEERRKNEMKRVLADIRSAIAAIGKAEKFDLVLRAPDYTGDFDEVKAGATAAQREADSKISAAELVRRFRDNPVLYFASGVDITEKVIFMLNDEFKKTATK